MANLRFIFLSVLFISGVSACDPATQIVGGIEIPLKPDFEQHIAPLMEKNCVNCHQTGGISPVDFESPENIAAFSQSIAFQVENRLMPPFNINNEGSCRKFKDARWLSESEIATFKNWADRGASTKSTRRLTAPALGKLDHASMSLPTPEFEPSIKPDHYRCFILDPELDQDKYLTGMSVVPGVPEITHHMLLFRVSDSALATAEKRNGADGKPGYDCFGLDLIENFLAQEMELVATWAPGVSANPFPANTGIKLPKGSKFIAQMHYNTIEKTAIDSSDIQLVIEEQVQREARSLLLDDFDLEVPAGLTEATYKWSFSLNSPQGLFYIRAPANGLDVLGVYPHMHERGVRQKLTYRPAGQTKDDCFYDVDRWNFGWQEFFYYEQQSIPKIEASGRISLECVYDTTGLNKPLQWGEGTQEEMCLTVLYVAESLE